MNWHGQINRTIWEIQECVKRYPDNPRYRRELLRAHFLQHFEFDKAFHVPRDDRTFMFLQDGPSPTCLMLHGATGTPAEMRELGNYLYARGYSVYCPRLSRTDTKERMSSWESWVTESQTALETVSTFAPGNAFAIGLSLGGTISMILSETEGLRGIVLLAPAVFPHTSLKMKLLQLSRIAMPTVFYRVAGWNGEVLKAMDFVRKTGRQIEVPVLAIQATDDRHLSHRGLKFVKKHTVRTECETTLLPHGTHVLTRGPAKGEVFERVHEFLEKHRGAPAEESKAQESES